MKNRVVTFHYVLKNKEGETLDSSHDTDPMSYVEGKQEIIRGLEEEVGKLKQGEKKAITVTADKAYGEYDKALVLQIPKDQFPQDEQVEVGDQFRMTMPGKPPRIFTVTELHDKHISVDGNHPLAGQDLFFDIHVTAMREATEADMKEDDCCGGDHDHAHHSH